MFRSSLSVCSSYFLMVDSFWLMVMFPTLLVQEHSLLCILRFVFFLSLFSSSFFDLLWFSVLVHCSFALILLFECSFFVCDHVILCHVILCFRIAISVVIQILRTCKHSSLRCPACFC